MGETFESTKHSEIELRDVCPFLLRKNLSLRPIWGQLEIKKPNTLTQNNGRYKLSNFYKLLQL